MFKWTRKDLIDSWDNTGFQIGDFNKDVKKVLLGLDLDRSLLNKAISEGFDMIITHHPIIFNPIKNITNESIKGNLILDIIQNDIVAYNAHSNLDIVENGVNSELANVLGLRNKEVLSKIHYETKLNIEGDSKTYGYGRVGDIEESSMADFIHFVKSKLDIEDIIVFGDRERLIKRVAVCGGSGGDFIIDAAESNADIYITGDIKYHDAQLAYELGLTVFDAGHFNTERIILPVIKEYLNQKFKDEIIIKVVMESGLPHKIY